jgi:hypothetical protein
MPAHQFPRRTVSAPFAVYVTDLPSWAPLPGQFANASTSLPSTVDPCPGNNCVYSDVTNFEAIWTAWNGGVYAPLLGAYGSLLCFGGGHFAYEGNCIVRFDIATRAWSLLTQPAPYGPGSPGWSNIDDLNAVVGPWGQYPDNTPYPFHTNMGVDYLAHDAGGGSQGSFAFISHDQTGVNCDDICKIWRCDLAQAQVGTPASAWSWKPDGSTSIAKFNAGDGSQQRNAICYDSKRKGLWIQRMPSGGLAFYSFLTSTETNVPLNSGNSFFLYNGAQEAAIMEYNEARDCIIAPYNDGANKIACIDLSGFTLGVSAFAPTHVITQSGTPPGSISSGSAPFDRPAYSSYDGHFYMLDWTSKSVARLYKLTVPATLTGTWVWSNETLTAKSGESLAIMPNNAGRSNGAAFYGRFRYVPALKSFIWSDGPNLHAQLGRPAAFV